MNKRVARNVIVIALVAVAMLPLLNTAAQMGYFGNGLRWWTQFLVPKRDLYDRLFEGPIETSESGKVFHYQLRHRYPGTHTFGIVASNEISMLGVDYWARDLDLTIECVADGKPPFRAKSDLAAWWGGYENGFDLAVYRVPRDLPLNGLVRCTVTVVRGDREFDETYDAHVFYAQKASEE